jgi:nucleotide-binding universal stress UspA family protein
LRPQRPIARAAGHTSAGLTSVTHVTAASASSDDNAVDEGANMRILLAIDDSLGSQAAIREAAERAGQKHAEVKVLHVVELPFSSPESTVIAYDHVGDPSHFGILLQELSRRAQVLVDNAVEELRRAGATASGEVEYGDPKSVILDAAAEWNAGLIVLGAHSYRGLERFLMGSVSEAVSRYAGCSVEIVRRPQEVGGRVLSSTDSSLHAGKSMAGN